MKLFVLLSLIVTAANAFAFRSDDVCEALYNQGDMRGYEDCISSLIVTPLSVPGPSCERFIDDIRLYKACRAGEFAKPVPFSVPRNLCPELFPIGSSSYESCMNGEFDKPMSIPRNLCSQYFGFNTPGYEACMRGDYDSAKTVPHSVCLRLLPHNPTGYQACIRGEFDEPLF